MFMRAMRQPFFATDGAACGRAAAAALRSARNSSRWRTRFGGISLYTSSNIVSGMSCGRCAVRSEEHTSELQSPCNIVCRLLLEKKKIATALPRCANTAQIPMLEPLGSFTVNAATDRLLFVETLLLPHYRRLAINGLPQTAAAIP